MTRPTAARSELSIVLGRRLRQLRTASGLSQRQVGRLMHTPRPVVARIEAGRHTPSLDTVRRFCRAVGAPTVEAWRALDEHRGWRFWP